MGGYSVGGLDVDGGPHSWFPEHEGLGDFVGEGDELGAGEGVAAAGEAEDADEGELLAGFAGEDADGVADAQAGGLGQGDVDGDLVRGLGAAAFA